MRRPSLYQAQIVLLGALVCASLAAGVWAALAPLPALPRERVIVIGGGEGAGGGPALPSRIHLTLGLQDVLVMMNAADRPQLVSGIPLAAGQTLRIPFHRAQDLQLACSAHPSGQLSIIVADQPGLGLARLRWRLERVRAML